MKAKFILLLAIAAFACAGVYAQSVTMLNPKKVTYERPKPIADHKKSFTVTYPKVKAATPALSKKIEAALSYEKAFDFKISEEIREIQWLEDAGYTIEYNADSMLSVALSIEGSGAYPSGSTKYVVVNTSTGTIVRPSDIFTNTKGLLAILTRMKDDEVKKTIADLKADPETKDDDVSVLFSDSEEYHKVSLDEFHIDEKGVVFHHDYGFPHVAQGIQPTGEFFLTWAELKPFIKSGGLLSKFAR